MSTLTAAASTGLDLNMSAAELRARLAARKKFDPKRDTIDLRRKHEIIQTMWGGEKHTPLPELHLINLQKQANYNSPHFYISLFFKLTFN